MKKLRSVLVTMAAALLIAVPVASAATVDDIIRDAKDGRVDGSYSQAELQAALDSPLLQTYGGKGGVEAVKSALGSQTDATQNSGNLPFTGAEMITFVLIGGGLLVAGFVLRRSGRRDDAA